MESPTFTLSFPVDFWMRYRISRALAHRMWNTWIGYAFFAGVPTVLFVMAFLRHWDLSRPGAFGLPGWAAFGASYVFIFLLVPLLQMLNLWLLSRRNRTLFGMQHQTFGPDGITARGESYKTTVGWDAIHKAVETPRYFFAFLSARGAFFIPKAHVQSGAEMTQVRDVLKHYLGDRAHGQANA